MNNKGQALVLFVLLIPVLIIAGIFIVDTAKILVESTKLKNTTKLVIKTILEDDIDEDKARVMFLENDINIDNLKITFEDTKINIKNNYKIDSLLGKIIGIKDYEMDINITGIKENNEIKYKKE